MTRQENTHRTPCGVLKPKERFLTAEQMARLNAVLTRDEFYCPQAVAIIRLLMLTGCRVSEVVSLEWDWIHGKRIHLADAQLVKAAEKVGDAIAEAMTRRTEA